MLDTYSTACRVARVMGMDGHSVRSPPVMPADQVRAPMLPARPAARHILPRGARQTFLPQGDLAGTEDTSVAATTRRGAGAAAEHRCRRFWAPPVGKASLTVEGTIDS